jgi:hypothetical protein
VLTPGYQAGSRQALVLGAAAALLAVGALLLRRPRSTEFGSVVILAGAALFVARTVLGPSVAVPGLLIAFPVALVALGLLVPDDLARDWQVLLTACLTVFAAAVVATQYAKGGGVEWGGRYFAIGIPVASVVGTSVLRRHLQHVPRAAATTVVVGLCVSSAALALLGAAALGRTHQATRQLGEVLASASKESQVAGKPTVVLTSQRFVPQLEWQMYDRFIWLTPTESDFVAIARRLSDSPPGPVLLLTTSPQSDLTTLGGTWSRRTSSSVPKAPGLEIVSLEPARHP